MSENSSPQSFPAAYVPLMLAISGLVTRSLTADYDYIPIGSLLISPSQILAHFSLRLLSTGTLLLTPHCQKTQLIRLSSAPELPVIDTRLVIAPSGSHGAFVSIADSPPRDSATIISNIFMSSGYRVLNDTMWCNVIVDGSPAACCWPIELCFFFPPWKPLDDSQDLEWFRARDSLDDVEKLIIGLSRPPGDMSPVAMSTVGYKRAAANVYPTPPDPQNHARQGPDASSSSWNGLSGDRGVYSLNTQWHADDEEEEPDLVTSRADEDALLIGDAEEVTEADFNFFDDDGNSPNDKFFGESNQMNMDDPDFLTRDIHSFNIEHMTELTKLTVQEGPYQYNMGSQVSADTNAHKPIMTPPLSPLTVLPIGESKEVLSRKRKSAFSALSFHPNLESALDNKYNVGGRFYVPDDASDDSESDNDNANSENEYSDYQDGKTPRSDKDEDRRELKRTGDILAEDLTSDAYVSRQLWWALLVNTRHTRDDYLLSSTQSSASTLTQSFLQYCAESSSSEIISILQTLCESVVWDNSVLCRFLPPLETVGVCDPDFVNVLKENFGPIQSMTLKEYALLSDSSSLAIGSYQSFHDTITDQSSQQQTLQNFMIQVDLFNMGSMTPDISTQPTIESDDPVIKPEPINPVFYAPPPHFSFLRMNTFLETLPPALRFWNVFGFEPQSGKKDIISFMVYPGSPGLTSAASTFLERFKPAYEGSSLGAFNLGEAGSYKNGLVPINYNGQSVSEALDEIKRNLISLGIISFPFVTVLFTLQVLIVL